MAHYKVTGRADQEIILFQGKNLVSFSENSVILFYPTVFVYLLSSHPISLRYEDPAGSSKQMILHTG